MTRLSDYATDAGHVVGVGAEHCNCVPAMQKDGSVTHAGACPVESTGPLQGFRVDEAPTDMPPHSVDWQARALAAERQLHDMLLRRGHGIASEISNNQLLEEILAVLKRANSTAREGAISSAELKFLANGTPQPTVKSYPGSDLAAAVDDALEQYGRFFREAKQRAEAGWTETVAATKVALREALGPDA